MTANHLLPPINRPQYVASPETLITALAWRNHTWAGRTSEAGAPQGLMYRSDGAGGSRVKMLTTYPDSAERLEAFKNALTGFGADSGLDSGLMAQGFADAVLGIRAPKAAIHPAAPLTPHLALLQDLRGYQGNKNPPDLGLILEQLYRLGVPAGVQTTAPSTRWLKAAQDKTARDPILSRLDDAVSTSLLPNVSPKEVPPVIGTGGSTPSPFTWFVTSWDRLTSEEWWQALPARVWVDWCCTVLRLAVGLGFLWEANWFDLYARALINNQKPTVDEISRGVNELIPWAPSDAETGVRDVGSLLKGRVQKGDAVRKLLYEDPYPARTELEDAWTNPGTAGANLWEAVRYALKTREHSGRFADHFGLLEQRGRWLFINPGTEWIVVIASLAAEKPGGVTDAKTVMTALHEIGLRPELRDLVILLEAAGLARGSADADYGLEVHSAY